MTSAKALKNAKHFRYIVFERILSIVLKITFRIRIFSLDVCATEEILARSYSKRSRTADGFLQVLQRQEAGGLHEKGSEGEIRQHFGR